MRATDDATTFKMKKKKKTEMKNGFFPVQTKLRFVSLEGYYFVKHFIT